MSYRLPPNNKFETLYNKVIDGGKASTNSAIILPKGTTQELDAVKDQAGTIAYDTTLQELVIDKGNGFVAAGGAGAVSTKLLINIMESTNGTVVAPNVPFTFTRTGDLIVLQIGAFSGTTGFNFAFFYEFLPVEFRPLRDMVVPYIVAADGVNGVGLIALGSSGHIDWTAPNFGTFGPGVVGSVPAMTISYLVAEPA